MAITSDQVFDLGAVSSAISIPPTAEDGVKLRDLTLQTLEVFLPYKNSESGRLFYSKQKFEQTLNLWKGKFFIYSPSAEHIDWESYLSNPAKELQKYDARIVGVNDGVVIPDTGSPRLDSFGWFWDDEVNELADSGRLGLSTDFNVSIIGEDMVGSPIPNYILVFPTDPKSGVSPNDIGSRVINTSFEKLEDKMDDETRGAIAELKGLITGFLGSFKSANVQNSAPTEPTEVHTLEVAPAVPVEYLTEMEKMKQENEATTAKLNDLTAQYEAMKAKDAERAEADKAAEIQKLESVWQTTIMPKLSPALLIDESKAAEIKEMAINRPLDFMQQYGDQLNKVEANVANSSVSGQTVQNSNVEDKPIVIGSYNAAKGAFE